jgi:MFS family permease
MTPTNTRYKVLSMCVMLAAITYLDRVCIANLAPHIIRDLGLSPVQMSFVFSAFTIAYGVFEMPTGYWGDRVGTRRVLTRIVAWWSSFTVATAAAWNYSSLLVIRFLFGVGEAGAWPNAGKTISMWFPAAERGRAQGIFFAGAHGAGGLTPLLVAALLTVMPWRGVFIAFGMIGFVWAFFWWKWFRDDPGNHPAVNQAERDLIYASRRVLSKHELNWSQLGAMLRNKHLLLLCLAYFTQSYGFYFYITWCPTYLEKARGFSAVQLGFAAGLPLFLCAIADVVGGIANDAACRRFGVRMGRAIMGVSSFSLASITMLAGVYVQDPILAVWLIAIAAGMGAMPLGAFWSGVLQLGGPHAGLAGAAMNTAGQLGGTLSPIVIGYVLQTFNDWDAPLYLTGILYTVGALCWFFIDAEKGEQG